MMTQTLTVLIKDELLSIGGIGTLMKIKTKKLSAKINVK